MGDVEEGVRETFGRLGIKNPETAPEKLAIYLAKALDGAKEGNVIAALSRELRQWLEEVRNQPDPSTDKVGPLIDRQ